MGGRLVCGVEWGRGWGGVVGDLSQPRIIFQALFGKRPLARCWLLRFR